MLIDRQKIYRVLSKDGRTKSYANENAFFDKYFKNEQSVLDLFKFLQTHKHKTGKQKGEVYVNYDEKTFFNKYACDLPWAKKTTYCGGGTTTGLPEWAKCLESSGAKKKNDNVVSIVNSKGNTLYFSKSGKFQYTFTKSPGTPNEMGNWRCNGTNGCLINMDNGDRWDGTKWIEVDRTQGGGTGSGGSTGGNVSQGWLSDPTGNKTWEYQVRDCKWIARKKGQTKEYVISDNPKYDSSVKILNDNYPDLLKNCNNSNSQQTPVNGGNSSTVTTVNLPVWSLSTGWMEQPSATQNPDENFGTSWTSPEQLTTPNQNESFISDLENVITEIDNLVNEELMVEQRVEIVQAPKDELNILRTNPMLKATGTLEALCRTNNGTSKPVNVNNKIYFAGKKINLKSGQPAYLTYDGMVLQRQGNSCNFTYVKDQNGLMHIKGIPYSDLELPFTEVLTQFGINPKDYNSDPYASIDGISKDLKNLVDVGAVSTIFKSWNDMLYYYHPDDYSKYVLVPIQGKSLTPPTNRGELSQYRIINGRNYGLMYNNKDVVIYLPKTSSPQVSGGGNEDYGNLTGQCRTALVEYLAAAIRFETDQDPSANPTINNSDNRTFIKGCYGANAYSGLTISESDLPTVSKDSRIFKWFRGKTLSIKEVSYLLSGKDKNLPSGKNPYLPFPLRKADMNESKTKLTNIIKENLSKLSEEKQNNLLAETRIIQTRTKLLMENRILKFKQPREKFFSEIISESEYLNKQGFDKELIKEEFWNKIKGLFGDHGSEAIFGTFKEYMSKWLVGKLTSVNPNGWMGEAIKKSVNDIHVDDIDKLTDCEFMTKRISLSITNEIINKVKNDEEVDGNISNIVKGGLTNSIDRTELLRNIESGVSKIICPELSNVEKKLEDKAEEMKQKAIKP